MIRSLTSRNPKGSGRKPSSGRSWETEMESALRPGEYIGYRDEDAFLGGLEEIETAIARLKPSRKAVELYETFLAGCYAKADDVKDDLGGFGGFIETLYLGWIRARQKEGFDSHETVEKLLKWKENDQYGYASDIEGKAAKVLDRKGLAALEAVLLARLEPGPGLEERSPNREHEYRRERLIETLKTLYAEKGSVQKYLSLCERTRLVPKDCATIAFLLKRRGKAEEALEWVERGFKLSKADGRELAEFELERLRGDLLVRLGRGDEALSAAFRKFEKRPSLWLYEDFMQYVPKAGRKAWHDRAMVVSEKADLRDALELWSKAGDLPRIIARVEKTTQAALRGLSHYVTEPIAGALAKAHPALAAKVYAALGMRILESKKSKYYAAALSHFQEARKCFSKAGHPARWEKLVAEIRAHHARKSSFMSDFEKCLVQEKGAKEFFLSRAKANWNK